MMMKVFNQDKLSFTVNSETILAHVDASIWLILFIPFVLPLFCYLGYIIITLKVSTQYNSH